MYRYIVNRVLLVVPTLVGAAALVFVLMRLIPGDICMVRLGSGGASVDPRALAVCHAELGLDRPLVLQFLDFAWGFFRLDFGISMWSGKPVAEEIAARLPISLEIAVMATVVAILIAIPLGTISALWQNSWIDHVVRTVAIAGIATPSFWLGIVSILVVLDVSHALFGAAWMPPIDYVPFWQDPLRNLSMVILPALTVGYRYSAVTMRMTRSAMLEVLREDYIRTARAKGLVEQLIINRHALKNALLPVVTLIGIEFAFLIGGLVVTEQVFNLNGVGRLFVLAVQNQDYTLTQALVMLTVAIFVLANLVVDLLYAWLVARRHHWLLPPPAARHSRPGAGAGDGGRRPLGRVDRALQPDIERFCRHDGTAELGTHHGHRSVRPRPALPHRVRRAHCPDRGILLRDRRGGRRSRARRGKRLFRRPPRPRPAARYGRGDGLPADHHGGRRHRHLRRRRLQRDRGDHNSAHPPLRAGRALERACDP